MTFRKELCFETSPNDIDLEDQQFRTRKYFFLFDFNDIPPIEAHYKLLVGDVGTHVGTNGA